jgi:hypothetical protein
MGGFSSGYVVPTHVDSVELHYFKYFLAYSTVVWSLIQTWPTKEEAARGRERKRVEEIYREGGAGLEREMSLYQEVDPGIWPGRFLKSVRVIMRFN